MADFLPAHNETMGDEGGASFNPHDKGNVVVNGSVTVPTYKGISPVFWGTWRGFAIITAAMATLTPRPEFGTEACSNWCRHLNKLLQANETLQRYVLEFYEKNFWQANRLQLVANQQVATWLYNHIVNGGGRGVKWMQLAAEVTADGKIGTQTIQAINAADPDRLLARAEDVAAFYRLDVAHDDPTQIQFLPSWLRRDGLSEAEILRVMQAARGGLTTEEVAALKQEIAAA